MGLSSCASLGTKRRDRFVRHHLRHVNLVPARDRPTAHGARRLALVARGTCHKVVARQVKHASWLLPADQAEPLLFRGVSSHLGPSGGLSCGLGLPLRHGRLLLQLLSNIRSKIRFIRVAQPKVSSLKSQEMILR